LPVRVGTDHVAGDSGPHLAAADDGSDLDLFPQHAREPGRQEIALDGAGRVGAHRLVGRRWWKGDAVVHAAFRS
jgi:hypothetical protein